MANIFLMTLLHFISNYEFQKIYHCQFADNSLRRIALDGFISIYHLFIAPSGNWMLLLW